MWKLPEVLAILERSSTEEQLVDRIGPPHAIGYGNWLSRDQLREERIFSPPQLLDSLTLETRMLVYGFAYPPSAVSGALTVYINDKGNILGWSYSRSLRKESAGGNARMDKRNFEK